jgi:hypothetical protein
MITYRSPSITRAPCFILGFAGAMLGLTGMASAQQPSLQNNQTVYLQSPAPPDTIPQKQPDWDYFAWNTFIALNWPALEVVPNRARGVPDLSKDFATAANSDLGVWETFKEKREIFNQIGNNPGQLIWYSPVDYGPPRKATGGLGVSGRVFHQNSGTSTPPNALDETVEVQSQAREPTLPDGTPNPIIGKIPPVVTPRVWRGQPSAKNPIVYEVKLNYDYFNYVVTFPATPLNVDNTDTMNGPVAKQAMGANIHLPIRTSSANLPPSKEPGANPAVFNYRAAAAVNQFKLINYLYNSGLKRPLPLPPKQGSIQVKAAWLKLGGAEAKPSDFPTWHTAIAVNYVIGTDGKPTPSEPTLFGLVGMHIIQRIHGTDPTNPANALRPGGTFIYATWEHSSIFNSPVAGQKNPPKPTYFYSNFYAGEAVEHGLKKGFYPSLDKPAYPVVRQFPVLDGTKKVNTAVHNAIKAKNPKSVWLNYHLVGTQFQAVNLNIPDGLVNPPNDPTRIGQPAFLSNLAIETNLGLQFFKGQPPGITVINNFQNNGVPNNNTASFLRSNANTSFSGKAVNMGGCMGCHGVAQTKGYGFSFVLLDGYLGAVTDTQEHFDQPGANPGP